MPIEKVFKQVVSDAFFKVYSMVNFGHLKSPLCPFVSPLVFLRGEKNTKYSKDITKNTM